MPNDEVATFDPANHTIADSLGDLPDTVTDWDFLDDSTSLGPVAEVPDEGEVFTSKDNSTPLVIVDSSEEVSPSAEPPAEVPSSDPAPTAGAPEPVSAASVGSPPLPAEAAEKVQYFEQFDTALRENPAAVAATIVEQLDPRTRAAFLAQFGVTGAPGATSEEPAFDASTYEGQSDMEAALLTRWDDISSIPHIIADTQAIKQDTEQRYNTLVPHISEANVASQMALARIDALCDALGIELPEASPEKVVEGLRAGASYRDAVRKAVDYKDKVAAHKQSRAPRPQTPGNSSRVPESIPEGTSMLTIIRKLNPGGSR